MSEVTTWAEATFDGCAANVGPLIGVGLQTGQVSIDTTDAPPSGVLAVLPLSSEIDDQPLARITLSSPLTEVVTLARRMLGEELEKESDLSEEDLDAIGEILNLMSGAVDQCVREHINSGIRTRPLKWWRTDDAGGQSFEPGEHVLASGSITVPDGTPVQLYLRFPQQLWDQGAAAESTQTGGEILLLGTDDKVRAALQPVLESARLTVRLAAPGSPEAEEVLGTVSAIVVSGDDPAGLELCRSLRTGNASWHTPIILSSSAPTKASVIAAMRAGATHVLVVPTDEQTLLRILNLARESPSYVPRHSRSTWAESSSRDMPRTSSS